MGNDSEENKTECTARYTTTSHDTFADFGDGSSDVATLQKSTDDTDEADEVTVLFVVPIKNYFVNVKDIEINERMEFSILKRRRQASSTHDRK